MIDLDMETESRLDEKNHGISEYEQLSFKDFLKHKSRETGDIPVLFEKDEIYTWMDLEMASQIIAEDLSKQGVRRGTHVGICGSNSINWISTFFAVHKLGAMALLINPQQRSKEIANIARIGEITHFCYGETSASIDELKNFSDKEIFSVSIKRGDGMNALTNFIVEKVGGINSEMNFVRDEREAELLRRAVKHLEEARRTIRLDIGIDFISIDLRSALECLSEFFGENVSEEIIDEIFSKFCIGK